LRVIFTVNGSEGAEQSVPEEIDNGEIGVGVSMVNEMQLLLPSEPPKPTQPATGDVIVSVQIDMRIEGERQRRDMGNKQIQWQERPSGCSDRSYGDQEEGCVIAMLG
jgi:hypothetical protein